MAKDRFSRRVIEAYRHDWGARPLLHDGFPFGPGSSDLTCRRCGWTVVEISLKCLGIPEYHRYTNGGWMKMPWCSEVLVFPEARLE